MLRKKGQHTPSAQGSQKKFKTGDSLSLCLHSPPFKMVTGKLTNGQKTFIWNILQQPQCLGIKFHCLPSPACGAAPCQSNSTPTVHTVSFSGGLSNWLIPLCGPLVNACKGTHSAIPSLAGSKWTTGNQRILTCFWFEQ